MPYPKSFYPIFRRCALSIAHLLIAGTVLAQQPRIAFPPKPYVPAVGGRGATLQGLQTIQNDQIRVGIDTRYGGAMTYLAFLDSHNGQVSTDNMVNNPDLGRQVQIALYGGPLDYSKNGSPAWAGLGWNPIQAGDTYGNPSEVVEIQKQQNLLYAKTIPKQFGLNNEPGQATIEHWIRLDGNVVKVHARIVMNRSDKTQYEARQQEMPCAYLNGDYHNMWYYRGGEPFTNGPLTLTRQQPPQTFLFGDVLPTEPWMASVNDNGYGMGLYVPNNYDWKRGYFGSDLAGNEFSNDASYIAATNYLLLDYNLVHEWDYELIVGNLGEIRQHIYNQPRPLAGPNYRFDVSRKGWYYHEAQDTGWPIEGKLHVMLTDPERDNIKSPFAFWKGRESPKIYLRAAFKTQNDKFRLAWRRVEDETIQRTGDRYTDFAIINDGEFHTYTIDLSRNENWMNYNIGQIEFNAAVGGQSNNGWVELEWVSTNINGPSEESYRPPLVNIPGIEEPVAAACEPGCAPVAVQKIRYVRLNQK